MTTPATAPAPAELAARILAAVSDGVMLADRDGHILFWSAGAERIFGFTSEEMLGRSMDVIIPERLRARHWAGWARVMETGVTRYGTETLAVPALRKDGTTISIEFTIALLRDDAGAILGPAAVVRDVSARFEREKAMKARLRELEAKASAADRRVPAGQE
jgi:PAS domain S-box-containing protein